MIDRPRRLFPLGQVVATPAAIEAMADSGQAASDFIDRHVTGDWGDCCEDDARENDLSLREGFRIFSVYHTNKGVKLWVITEADRSSTCVLLPSDY